MEADFDVIVVGSGPAGVSAAFPLVEAGLRVLMIDGGRAPRVPAPATGFLDARSMDREQWEWIVGRDFRPLGRFGEVSPKLRVPTHGYVFDDFLQSNRIGTDGYTAIGSLAIGGLSNAWGCGVAKLGAPELTAFPFAADELERSYEIVARRIGLSGSSVDDLSDYFGVDDWAQPPIDMDASHMRILSRYERHRAAVAELGFRLGRSRVAVLSADHAGRRACDLSGNCLFGCHRRSLYSAADELEPLLRHANFRHEPGLVIEKVSVHEGTVTVAGGGVGSARAFSAQRVLLAAGTLASTALVLRALKFEGSVRMLSCPTAAFLLWAPRLLGAPRTRGFGLGQLSYVLEVGEGVCGFGSTFSTTGIPMAEFVRHLPLRKPVGVDVLRNLLSSCLAGNIFLPGSLSAVSVGLDANGVMRIDGGYAEAVPELMALAERKLRKAYRKLGFMMLPTSFTIGRPGGDIHYAGTLPMRLEPLVGESGVLGEVAGLSGVHVVDGAALPDLSEKSHTLTIMANADRIGRQLARRMFGRTV